MLNYFSNAPLGSFPEKSGSSQGYKVSKGSIALVRPEMLKWARETAGMSSEIAAQRMRLSVAKLKLWEEGRSAPTIKQAHHLAEIYHQPFAAFYLPKPPHKKYPKVKDYRKL